MVGERRVVVALVFVVVAVTLVFTSTNTSTVLNLCLITSADTVSSDPSV
jgi:hypothetical protein